MAKLSRALFLDRDGVVNREVGYLWKPEHTEFIPGIFELCRVAQRRQYKLIVLTNQSGIARQLYSESDFHVFMRWMILEFACQQIHLDGYYYCPHHPDHGIGRYRVDCMDRKPKPGMLLRAAHDHEIDLSQSAFIGDRCSDILAGAAAAVGKIILIKGTESEGCPVSDSYIAISNLLEAVPFLASTDIAPDSVASH